jgi:hypothetical protein
MPKVLNHVWWFCAKLQLCDQLLRSVFLHVVLAIYMCYTLDKIAQLLKSNSKVVCEGKPS